MRRPLQLIQDAFENVLANWPVVLIALAGQVAMIFIVIAGVIVALLPIMAGGVMELIGNPDEIEQWIEATISGNPLIIVYILAILGVVLIPVMILYSFLEAGKIGVYLDGERSASHSAVAGRERYKVFDPARWFAWGRQFWWRLFLIYNVLWGVLLLVLLLIGAVAALLIALLIDNPAAVAVGCIALLVVLFVMIVGGMLTFLWTQLAVTVTVRDGRGVLDGIGEGWRLLGRRLGDSVLLSILLIIISFAIATLFSSFFFGMGLLNAIPGAALILAPLQIVFSLLQSLVQSFVSSLVSAAFAGFALDDAGEGSSARAVLQ
jgi:hypothetical protein